MQYFRLAGFLVMAFGISYAANARFEILHDYAADYRQSQNLPKLRIPRQLPAERLSQNYAIDAPRGAVRVSELPPSLVSQSKSTLQDALYLANDPATAWKSLLAALYRRNLVPLQVNDTDHTVRINYQNAVVELRIQQRGDIFTLQVVKPTLPPEPLLAEITQGLRGHNKAVV